MLGLGVLVALARRLVGATLAETGLLPASYYRHLALTALEEEDFPQSLKWLRLARDPLLTQLLVLRLRLLAAKHEDQRRALQELLALELSAALRERGLELLRQEERALSLLQAYEAQALALLPEASP
jgi:hypothetical protein|uniref:Uncharacterized protein n=1 Tax=Desulfobacca acetoxidans TaxID=60893 RepID=A0A7C5ENM2_9BACT